MEPPLLYQATLPDILKDIRCVSHFISLYCSILDRLAPKAIPASWTISFARLSFIAMTGLPSSVLLIPTYHSAYYIHVMPDLPPVLMDILNDIYRGSRKEIIEFFIVFGYSPFPFNAGPLILSVQQAIIANILLQPPYID